MRMQSDYEPCSSFRAACEMISAKADRLRDSKKFYDERSAVSDFLDLLQERCPDRVVTWQRGINESRSGADLEMWLVSKDRWVGFRIQAKVHQGEQDSYGHLDHPNGTGQQVANLISKCPRGLIPLYLLFSGAKASGKIVHECECPMPPEYGAITVADAKVVQKLVQQGTITANDVRASVKPLICLFCCEPTGDLVERAIALSISVTGIGPRVTTRPPKSALELIRYKQPLTPDKVEANSILVLGQSPEDLDARPNL